MHDTPTGRARWHVPRTPLTVLAVTFALATAPLAATTLVAVPALAADGAGSITVAPTTLLFPETFVGTSSSMQPVALTNVTSSTVTPSLAGGALIDRTDFASDGQTCGALAPGESCDFRYHFTPTKPGRSPTAPPSAWTASTTRSPSPARESPATSRPPPWHFPTPHR